jgi:hypothetical protein
VLLPGIDKAERHTAQGRNDQKSAGSEHEKSGYRKAASCWLLASSQREFLRRNHDAQVDFWQNNADREPTITHLPNYKITQFPTRSKARRLQFSGHTTPGPIDKGSLERGSILFSEPINQAY